MSAADGADDAAVRSKLRKHGESIGSRGRISDAQYARYNELSGAATAPPPRPGVGAAADADGDWLVGDDETAPAAPSPAAGGAPPPLLESEQRPRSVRPPGPTAADRVRGLRDRLAGGKAEGAKGPGAGRSKAQGGRGGSRGAKGKPRPEQPWRPTAGVIGSIWERAAQSAGGVPPLQRILAAQAPMAGVVLEDQFRGTLVDRVLLQPAARWEAQTETVTAMAGVPVMVALIAFRGRVQMVDTPAGPRPVIRPDGMPVWEPGTEMMVGSLKYCLMSWMSLSGKHAEEIKAQGEETLRLGRQADDIIRWIFAPPDPEQSWNDVRAEAESRPWEHDAPPPPPAPASSWGPPPGPPPGGSSAFRPALTGSVLPRGGGG